MFLPLEPVADDKADSDSDQSGLKYDEFSDDDIDDIIGQDEGEDEDVQPQQTGER